MRSWPKAFPVVGGLKTMLRKKYALAAKGIGGWMYGTRDLGGGNSFHNGLDLPCSVGTPAYAMWDGVIETTASDALSGLYVIVRHDGLAPRGRVSYCHLNAVGVKQGQLVKAGEPVGLTGQSGHCLGAHLHLTVKALLDGGFTDVDPMHVLRESCWL